MKLVFQPNEKPKFGANVVFAIQQLLAIMAATLVVPVIINTNAGLNGAGIYANMSPAAALFGAGVGTFVYLLFTKFRSPVFLGSSFAFIGSMCAAFAGAATVGLGYLGLIIGAALAGLVYVVLAIVVKLAGVQWINRMMPAVVIGPTVALIGLSLAGSAIGDLQKAKLTEAVTAPAATLTESGEAVVEEVTSMVQLADIRLCILVGIITLLVTVIVSTFGKKMAKMIPFIIGILAGYAVASVLTAIGHVADVKALMIVDYSPFIDLFKNGVQLSSFVSLPDFTFLTALGGFKDFDVSYLATVAAAYVPVAFVVFAEHIADHKNLSSIIEKDLLEDPGLHRTLLGDGVGSIAGAFFGGCPNTTYGESVACVAISGNASVYTIATTAALAILISFLSPFVAFVNSIPSCVMGGICIALYGFIAVSGLKMIQKVDLEQNKNLFVVSTILVSGIGGLSLTFGKVSITSIACALILGIIVNVILSQKKED